MNKNNENDAENQFANEWELLHQQILGSPSDVPNNDSSDSSDRANNARDVLILLEELRQQRNETVGLSLHSEASGERDTSPGETKVTNRAAQQSTINDAYQNLSETSSFSERLPSKVGRFQLHERIGVGGFGIVFRATDPALGRNVALKIPRLETSLSVEAKRRFQREAAAAATLDHPHVAKVFETGTDSGIHFIVSQFVDGENLATLLARGVSLSFKEVAMLVADLADALQHAHEHGILHRDLKPSNVLIPKSTADAEFYAFSAAKLTDFGLADVGDRNEELTRTGAIVGTPAYMAPEQAQAKQNSISEATDVYGLGALMYRLLAGEPPYSGESLIAIIRAMDQRDPISIRSLNPDTPRDLEAICLKCLERKPENRYASASELKIDVRNWLDGRPVSARPVSHFEKAKRWCVRNPMLATASAAAMIFLVSSLVASTVGWLVTSSALSRMERANERSEQRSHDLKLAFDDLFSSIEMAPEVKIPGAESLLERLLQSIDRYNRSVLLENSTDIEANISLVDTIHRIATLRLYLGDSEGALASLEKAGSFLNRLSSKQQNVRVAELHHFVIQSRILAAEGQRDNFLRTADEVVSLSNSLAELTDDAAVIEAALACSELSDAAMSFGDRTSANRFSEQAIQFWDLIDPTTLSPNVLIKCLISEFTAGNALAASENWAEAQEALLSALARSHDLIDSEANIPPDFAFRVANTHRNVGIMLHQNKLESERHFQAAELLLEGLHAQHPMVADYPKQICRLGYSRALAHFLTGDNEDAAQRLTSNADDVRGFLSQYPYEAAGLNRVLADTLALAGICNQQLKRFDLARENLEQAKSVNELLVSLSGGSLLNKVQLHGVIGSIAALEVNQGNDLRAIELLTKSNQELQQLLEDDPQNGESRRFLAGNLEVLCEAHVNREDWPSAKATLNEWVRVAPSTNPAKAAAMGLVLNTRLHEWNAANENLVQLLEFKADFDEYDEVQMSAEVKQLINALVAMDEEFLALNDSLSSQVATDLRAAAMDATLEALNTIHQNSEPGADIWSNLFTEEEIQNWPNEIKEWRLQNEH
ncbi:MAG: serine/threonine-protein kinase [Pirellulaceae bacterium]